MNKMILLEGIPKDLNLGIPLIQHGELESLNKEGLAYLSTFIDEKTVNIGIIELNLENISKLRNFKYVFLIEDKNNNKWIKNSTQLKLLIPRDFEENEIIRGFSSEEVEF